MRWHWEAFLQDEKSHHYMVVQVQKCSEAEAEQLAWRQNLTFAKENNRAPYLLLSLKKVNSSNGRPI
jgi:hypothetical protein